MPPNSSTEPPSPLTTPKEPIPPAQNQATVTIDQAETRPTAQLGGNTSHNIVAYIGAHYRLQFFSSVIASFFLPVLIAILIKHPTAIAQMWFIPFIVIVFWYRFVGAKLESQLLQKYAQLHGWSYIKKPIDFKPTGPLYKVGHSTINRYLVSGTFPGIEKFFLFLHTMTIGYGKGSHQDTYCVISMYMTKAGPHMYLARQQKYGQVIPSYDIKTTFNQAKKYQLEGDFDSTYILYGESNDQIDLLEVINPSVMERLVQLPPYDIELNINVLSFYRYGEPVNSEEIDAIMEIAKTLLTSFEPIIQRMDEAASLSAKSAQSVPNSSNIQQ